METNIKFDALDIPGANNMTIHVMAAVAQNEAETISRHTKDAIVAAKARGTKLASFRPGAVPLSPGARKVGQTLGTKANREDAILENADVAKLMQRLAGEGLSLRQIANQLNTTGHGARNGEKWHSTQVQRVVARVNHKSD